MTRTPHPRALLYRHARIRWRQQEATSHNFPNEENTFVDTKVERSLGPTGRAQAKAVGLTAASDTSRETPAAVVMFLRTAV
ncbi:unnamed protein product [Boreogadus saida]